MGSPVPPSSLSISQIPADQPPTFSMINLFYFLVTYFIVSLIYLLVRFFCCHRLFPVSPRLHDADPTPSDANLTIVLELLKSGHIIIYIGDSPSSSEARPSFESSSCPICLDELAEGEEVRSLPRCRHAYHRACIDQWLVMGSHSCPVCRDRVAVRLAEVKNRSQMAIIATAVTCAIVVRLAHSVLYIELFSLYIATAAALSLVCFVV